MRPDRIIVGEVRGAESLDMLQAMNTGHDGSLSTVHANSPADALLRLENMLNMGATFMSSELVRRQLSSALDLLIQIERDASGARRVIQICEVCPCPETGVRCEDIFAYHIAPLGGQFLRTSYRPAFEQKILASGLYERYREILGV
jgi:pilus assembly protein CpaF